MAALQGRTFRLVHDFEARGPGELSVNQGQLVFVPYVGNEDGTNTDGWVECVTVYTGQQGFVPLSYLELVSNDPASIPPTATAFEHIQPNSYQNRSHSVNPFDELVSLESPPVVDHNIYSQASQRINAKESSTSGVNSFGATLQFWRDRERRFKSGEQQRLPTSQKREYFYWDRQGRRIGPLSESQMRARFDKRQLAIDTLVSLVSPYIQPGTPQSSTSRSILPTLPLSDYFPTLANAFMTAPSAPHRESPNTPLLWCYLDDSYAVQGPFPAALMRKWFQDGYFSGETLVRLASDSPRSFATLGSLFPNGEQAFLSAGGSNVPRVDIDVSPSLPTGSYVPFVDVQPATQTNQPPVWQATTPPFQTSPSAMRDGNIVLSTSHSPQRAVTKSNREKDKNHSLVLADFDPFAPKMSTPATTAAAAASSKSQHPTNFRNQPTPKPADTLTSDAKHTIRTSVSGKHLLMSALSNSESNLGSKTSPANRCIPANSASASHRWSNERFDERSGARPETDTDDAGERAIMPLRNNRRTLAYDELAAKLSTIKARYFNQGPREFRHFIAHPLPRDLGVMRCRIHRSTHGFDLSPNTFELALEDVSHQHAMLPVILVAKRRRSLYAGFHFDIMYGPDAPSEAGAVIAQLSYTPHIFGSTSSFLLHNDAPGHSGQPSDLGAVIFSKALDSTKEVKAVLPKTLYEHGELRRIWPHHEGQGPKHSALAQSLIHYDLAKVHALTHRPPVWNERLQSFTLDFHGRATYPSIKNFQMATVQEPKRVVLLHGRTGPDLFVLDFTYPLTPLAAFAIAIASNNPR